MELTINLNLGGSGTLVIEPSPAARELVLRFLDLFEVVPSDKPAETQPQEPAPVPAVQVTETPAESKEPAIPSKEDVRAAMDAAFAKFGAKSKGDPNYDKYHSQLTRLFKTTADDLAEGCKPSSLPEDKRAAFIEYISDLILEGDLITPRLPF